jgi:hypothetical protein
MRIARREASAVFAAESITSPEKTALLGITFPSIKVATASLALILAPTGVLPAATLAGSANLLAHVFDKDAKAQKRLPYELFHQLTVDILLGAAVIIFYSPASCENKAAPPAIPASAP